MEKDGSNYTEQELKDIRAFLFKLADMDYTIFLKHKLREQEFDDNSNQLKKEPTENIETNKIEY
jgi:hypothetical protein